MNIMKLHHAYDKRKGNEMKLKNEKEVKTWLRKLPLLKKELELKIDFYTELVADFKKTSSYGKHVDYYNEKIDELKRKIDLHLNETEKILGLLNETERLILTAKYIKMIKWDFMEYHVFYCRRQAIRIHNEALKKLIGIEVID